ncbi:MAG TPA: glycosyltransferase [Phycisphaerae bacterium]|nr:glycosyltransferase [Phycisphaerae bacterium]
MRVMAVCHDSVGIGHIRRTMAIAERATQAIPSCRVLVVSGEAHTPFFALPERVDYVKVPSICKGPDYRYTAKSLGVSFQDALRIRSAILTATTASYRPDVFLIDKSPLGVQGEAESALRLVRDRSPNSRVIFGMRDIEDAPERTINEWRKGRHLDALKHLVDEIWVYGSRNVFDVVEAYQLPDAISEKIRYMGYIARRSCQHTSCSAGRGASERRLLVTVGGGTDGYRLIDQYLSSPVVSANGYSVQTTIVGGPDLPRPQAEKLRARAAEYPSIQFEDFVPCMDCAYKESDAILCMGGYNTMVEVVKSGKPMLVYPRVEPRLEQYIRARRFNNLHYCRLLDPNCMTPATIQAAVQDILANGNGTPTKEIDLDGLTAVASRLSELEASLRDEMAVFV